LETGAGINNNDASNVAQAVATLEVEAEGKKHGGKKQQPQPQQLHEPEIPMVDAVAVPEDAIQASSTAITADIVVLGGDAVLRQQASRRTLSDLVPMAPPPSLPTLLNEMKASINDYELIAQKISDEPWTSLFQRLSADEFGSIVGAVQQPFVQPRVASLLAPLLHNGHGIRCADVAAAVRSASGQHRAVMAQRLLPLCTDVKQNHAMVRSVLSDWEQTVCCEVLEEAMR